jgi:hypothetical protein
MPVVFGLRYWSRVALTLFVRHHLPGAILPDGDTLSPSAPIANTACAYAPPTPAMHMRPTHTDSSPAYTAMPSHMPHAYAVGLESCDDHSNTHRMTRIPCETTTHLSSGGPRASPELVRLLVPDTDFYSHGVYRGCGSPLTGATLLDRETWAGQSSAAGWPPPAPSLQPPKSSLLMTRTRCGRMLTVWSSPSKPTRNRVAPQPVTCPR